MDAIQFCETINDVVEELVPGCTRERQAGDFYRWRSKEHEAQLFCLDNNTAAIVFLEAQVDHGSISWTPTDVQRCEIQMDAARNLGWKIAMVLGTESLGHDAGFPVV